MTTTSLDLSGKIDNVAVSALGRIHQISSSMKIPFFIVGATARDILLEVHCGIGSKRATLDIDIAVFIENWEQFYHLKDELIGIKHFTPTRDIHRLLFQKRLPVDIVPFGGVAEKDDLVEWPPDGSIKMSLTGFRECFQHAVQVKISDKPKLSVSVVSLAGLAILKLVSWDDNSARRQKDASDLVFIILRGESKNKRGHGIAMDVLQGDRFADESYEKVSAYFDALLKGLTDHKNR